MTISFKVSANSLQKRRKSKKQTLKTTATNIFSTFTTKPTQVKLSIFQQQSLQPTNPKKVAAILRHTPQHTLLPPEQLAQCLYVETQKTRHFSTRFKDQIKAALRNCAVEKQFAHSRLKFVSAPAVDVLVAQKHKNTAKIGFQLYLYQNGYCINGEKSNWHTYDSENIEFLTCIENGEIPEFLWQIRGESPVEYCDGHIIVRISDYRHLSVNKSQPLVSLVLLRPSQSKLYCDVETLTNSALTALKCRDKKMQIAQYIEMKLLNVQAADICVDPSLYVFQMCAMAHYNKWKRFARRLPLEEIWGKYEFYGEDWRVLDNKLRDLRTGASDTEALNRVTGRRGEFLRCALFESKHRTSRDQYSGNSLIVDPLMQQAVLSQEPAVDTQASRDTVEYATEIVRRNRTDVRSLLSSPFDAESLQLISEIVTKEAPRPPLRTFSRQYGNVNQCHLVHSVPTNDNHSEWDVSWRMEESFCKVTPPQKDYEFRLFSDKQMESFDRQMRRDGKPFQKMRIVTDGGYARVLKEENTNFVSLNMYETVRHYTGKYGSAPAASPLSRTYKRGGSASQRNATDVKRRKKSS